MKKLKTLFYLTIASSLCLPQSNVWNKLNKGNYDVGLKVFSLYDSSRTINGGGNYRPVQISMWYPADVLNNSKQMQYRDYFLLSASENNFQISKSEMDSSIAFYKNLLSQNGITSGVVDEWFNTQMIAYKDAAPLKAEFPLVVVAQGNYHSAHHQSFLCEFLASNGFVVITTPSQTRISGQLTDDSQAVESADEQIKDMNFAINSLQNISYIDFNNMALIGHSFGGRSILLFQMNNEKIKCLISLDGGLGLNTAIGDIKDSPHFNLNKMDVPLLHIYEDSEESLKPDFSLINLFNKSERFLLKIEDMRHFYFSSLGFVSGTIAGFSPVSNNLTEKYRVICDISLQFLNSVLKADDSDLKELDKYYSSLTEKTTFLSYEHK